MVDLAHSFGLPVVAEGVEDEVTAQMLLRLGVDQAQGFLYSPAVPADQLEPTAPARGDDGVAGTRTAGGADAGTGTGTGDDAGVGAATASGTDTTDSVSTTA